MPDALAIGGLLQSFSAITNIGKALIGMRDAEVIKEKVIELNGEILAAQQSALATQRDQFTLLEEKRALEEEIAKLKAWDAQKQKYHLQNVREPNNPHGPAFAYTMKVDAGTGEPMHSLCAKCFEERHKSILQQETRDPGMIKVLFCPRCSGEISLTGLWYQTTPRLATVKVPKRGGPR